MDKNEQTNKTRKNKKSKNKKKSGKELTISALSILLSKLNIDNSKELKTNIKNLLNYLHDTKQITKQVYNNLIKAITYVQSTNVDDIYKNDS